jgi:hypothetical protein
LLGFKRHGLWLALKPVFARLEIAIVTRFAMFTRLTIVTWFAIVTLLARLKSALLVTITEGGPRPTTFTRDKFTRLLIAACFLIANIRLRGKAARLDLRTGG